MGNFFLGIIGGIIGGIAGFIGFGPVGALAGFSIGTTIGGMTGGLLFPGEGEIIKGPRLTDLKSQTSAYSFDTPKVDGAMRVSGNVIWERADGLIAKRKIRHLDGDAEFWEYNYYANFAVELCEGEIIGIKRMWLNGKLYIDLSDSLSIEYTLQTSNQRTDILTVYTGSESQTADPLIEADVGSGNAPAYRGKAYIVFNELPLKNYSNSIPNVSVEVVQSGSISQVDWKFDSPALVPYGVVLDGYGNLLSVDFSAQKLYYHSGISDTVVSSWDLGFAPKGIAIWNSVLWISYESGGSTYIVRCKGISGNQKWSKLLFNDDNSGEICIKDGKLYIVRNYLEAYGTYAIHKFDIVNARRGGDDINLEATTSGIGDYHNSLNCKGLTFDQNGNFYETHIGNAEIYKRADWNGALLDTIDTTSLAMWPTGAYWDKDNDLLIICDSVNDEIRVLDGYSASYKTLQNTTYTTANVDDIVGDICDEVGITSSLRDVTDLSGLTTAGYARTKTMSARAALEPLMIAHQFDAAEIDHKLHFIQRGGANQATIDADELAAHAYGAAEPGKILISRKDETELPKEVNVAYTDALLDYQNGLARARRIETNSSRVLKIDLPLVLSNTTAKQVAEIIHNAAYTEKTRYSFSTSMKYIYLAPTDVITVDGHKMRIETMVINDGLLQIEGPAEDDANYTSAAATEDPSFSGGDIPQYGPAIFEFLDIPLLADTHDNAGFYIAAHGYFSGWVGAVVYVSADGGQTFAETLSVMNESEIGYAEGALADGRAQTWDRGNTVTVQLNKASATLANAAEADVLSGSNWAALGVDGRWEIIAFANVTDNGDGNYTLDTLLRGLNGTEHNTANHAADDLFVLLDTDNLGRLNQGTGLIGTAQSFKVVSVLEDPQSVAPVSFTNNGVGLECYAPVYVAGSRDGSDNLTITWIRRGRVYNEWDDNADIPLGESTEAYEVDVYDNGSVVRTIEVTSETASYTAAQQTTDGLTPGDPVHVKVYQLSADAGRGYEVDATI